MRKWANFLVKSNSSWGNSWGTEILMGKPMRNENSSRKSSWGILYFMSNSWGNSWVTHEEKIPHDFFFVRGHSMPFSKKEIVRTAEPLNHWTAEGNLISSWLADSEMRTISTMLAAYYTAWLHPFSSPLSMLGSHRDQWQASVAAWRFVHCLAIVEGGKTADGKRFFFFAIAAPQGPKVRTEGVRPLCFLAFLCLTRP